MEDKIRLRYRGCAALLMRGLTSIAMAMAAATAYPQTAFEGTAEEQIESVFATSLILTDSEAITFGLLNFDPENFAFPIGGGDLGSEESLERRRSVRTYALPGKWQFGDTDARFTPHVQARLIYFEAEQDVVMDENGEADAYRDYNKDRVYGGYLETGFSYQLSEKWKAVMGAGVHLLQYDNNYESSGSFTDVVEPATDGLMFDSSATAFIGELQPRLVYADEWRGLPWKFQSTYSYYRGRAFRSDDQLGDVEPQTWSWSNGVTVLWPMPQVFDTDNQLRFLARRIDLGGDATGAMATDNYYEFGVGWLFEGPENWGWMDNIGLSVSVNAGSALSGGSLVLLYNEDW